MGYLHGLVPLGESGTRPWFCSKVPLATEFHSAPRKDQVLSNFLVASAWDAFSWYSSGYDEGLLLVLI